MHKMDCEHCVHAKRNRDGERVRVGNVVMVQNGGGYTCTTNVKEMSMVGDDMLCSEFEALVVAEGEVV